MAKPNSSLVQDSIATLESLDENLEPLEERVTSPAKLRTIHEAFSHNDRDSAEGRAMVQELVDFVPPYDAQELKNRGQADRFNVNFGLVSSIVNEAVGSYLDIYANPPSLLKLRLDSTVGDEEKGQWEAIMSEEFTEMIRSWDAATPLILLLDNILVTHGVAIPWFEDSNNIAFQVGGMEDFNFDDDALAIASQIEATTVSRRMSASKLFSKIDGKKIDSEGFTSEGWNIEAIKNLIRNASSGLNENEPFNFEEAHREWKGNRITGGKNLPAIDLIWGFIREMDGTYSVYAAADQWKQQSAGEKFFGSEDEPWVFRSRHRYRDANQAFQIFSFGVGNKNYIHTIRGLGYFLYEAGQADNVIKCKGLDAVRMRASEIYQPSGGVESEKDLQILDTGPMMIIPQTLRAVATPQGNPLDKTFGVGQAITREVMDRHSGGLASSGGVLQNPAARRNELQVAAELDHLGKLLSFAINLYYPSWEKFLRELGRRAFTQTQTDLETIDLVRNMKKRCIDRQVPKEMFSKIDFKQCKATRVIGAGSRGTRMLTFSQMSELFPEMDPEGRERFTFDWSTEMVGYDKSVDYFGRPGERRGHEAIEIARLENARLTEGDFIEITPGQNNMVHLQVHIQEGLEPALGLVEEGQLDFREFVTENVTLFEHAVAHLEATTVHESLIQQLNQLRQRIQQIGEVIENGLREINAERRREGEAPMEPGQEGEASESDQKAQMAQQESQQKQQEASMSLQVKMAEAQAKLEMLAQQSEAKIALMTKEGMAKIALKDAETAAKIKRETIIESAK
jgi:hypothetical protein